MAMSGEQSFAAVGSSSYVAGAAIGHGLGNAVRQNSIYNACMEAQGFVAVDELPKTAAPTPVTAASASANRPYTPGQYYAPAAALGASPCGDGPGGASGGPGQELVIKCGDR